MLGIAGDVYWKDLDEWNIESSEDEDFPRQQVAYSQEIRR
jgi:hypothetical protein